MTADFIWYLKKDDRWEALPTDEGTILIAYKYNTSTSIYYSCIHLGPDMLSNLENLSFAEIGCGIHRDVIAWARLPELNTEEKK